MTRNAVSASSYFQVRPKRVIVWAPRSTFKIAAKAHPATEGSDSACCRADTADGFQVKLVLDCRMGVVPDRRLGVTGSSAVSTRNEALGTLLNFHSR